MRRRRIGLNYKKIHFGFPKGIPVKLTVTVFVIILAMVFSAVKLIRFLRSAEYFKIRQVIFSEESKLQLSRLKGQNIFTVSPNRISEYIKRHHPVYRNVRVVRVLPNRIFVNLTRRTPLAVIESYRYFYIDKDAVLFDTVNRFTPPEGLPVIKGLERKIVSPKLGTRYNIEELLIILEVLRRIGLDRKLVEYKFKKIYAENPSNISFFMLAPLSPKGNRRSRKERGFREVEIKIDAHSIEDKYSILTGILGQVGEDLGNVRYIDLRFKEPVIRFNKDRS